MALAAVAEPGLPARAGLCPFALPLDLLRRRRLLPLPLTSPPTVQGIVAHVLGHAPCSASSSVAELRFEGLRPSHDNLQTCPDAPVVETYVHRNADEAQAYDLGFGLVMSSATDALHHIHVAELQPHRKSVKVAHDVAFGYHFSDRCWPQYYRQKCFGRGSIRDWDIPDDVDETHPTREWWNIGKVQVVADTRLRDFKRTLVGPAPAPVIRRAPFNYTCDPDYIGLKKFLYRTSYGML